MTVDSQRQLAKVTNRGYQTRKVSMGVGVDEALNTPKDADFIEFQTGAIQGANKDKLEVKLVFDYLVRPSKSKTVEMESNSAERVSAGLFMNAWLTWYSTGGRMEATGDGDAGYSELTMVLATYRND